MLHIARELGSTSQEENTSCLSHMVLLTYLSETQPNVFTGKGPLAHIHDTEMKLGTQVLKFESVCLPLKVFKAFQWVSCVIAVWASKYCRLSGISDDMYKNQSDFLHKVGPRPHEKLLYKTYLPKNVNFSLQFRVIKTLHHKIHIFSRHTPLQTYIWNMELLV